MDLLKHGNFVFKNILSGGYKIIPNKPKVLAEITMAGGAIKRNYGEMPKTTIKIKFGRLDGNTYREYMSHFLLPEDNYTYYDTDSSKYFTKRFFVTRPEDSLINAQNSKEKHDEFEIILEQCGEVSE